MRNIQQINYLIRGIFSVLLFAASSYFFVAQAEESDPQERIDALERSLQTIMKNHNVPGVQGVIVTNDKVIWKGHLGVTDIETQESVTPSTLFRIGSISKSITSLAILKAVENGKINLDMNIETALPEAGMSNRWSKENPILLKHVLEHTAGFDDIHPRDFTISVPNAKLLDGIQFNNGSRSARWRPGTRMSYSNMGPAIGALALEKATGEVFEDYVQREVFDELGMTTATFLYDPAISKSYSRDGKESPYIHIGARPSGSAALTTSDMLEFVLMFLNRGAIVGKEFLSSDSIARMEISTSTLSAKKGMKTGYGLGNAVSQKDGHVYHGHTGGIDGFLSSFDYLPEQNVGYFFSMNMSNEAAFIEIGALLHKFITEKLPAREKPTPVSLSPEEMTQISGFYKPVSSRWQLMQSIELFFNMKNVQASEGGIEISTIMSGSEPEKFFSLGGQQYRQKDEVQSSMMFHELENGKQYLQSMAGTFEKVSFVSVLARWMGAIFAVVFILTCWGYAVVWGLQMVRGRFDYQRDALVRILPFVTTLLIPFCVVSLVLSVNDLSTIYMPKLSSISFCVGTWVFAIMSVISIFYVGKRWEKRNKIGRFAWVYSLMIALAMMLITVYFSYHGFIGMRLWAY